MTDILIRGVPDDELQRIDAAAEQTGLSRNEFLKRLLHAESERSPVRVTVDDFREVALITADLDDDEVMRGAWS